MNKVAVKNKNELSIASSSWIEDAGLGIGEAMEDEFKLPLIKILYSSNMPDIETTVSGTPVSEGCIFNQTSEKAYDGKKGFRVVPVYYKRSFNEWKEMQEGNNRPVAVHKEKPLGLTRSGNKDVLPSGNYVEDTGNWFVMVIDDDENIIDQGLITMKSTQKKKSNEWLQKLKSKTVMVEGKAQIPPFYLNVYRLNTTRQESNKYKFFGWSIKFEGYLTKQETVDQTKAFAHLAKDFNLYYETSSEEGGEINTAKSSDKVPF